MGNYLPSLKQNIKKGNTDRAKKLLSDLGSRYMHEKLEVLEALALAPDKVAWDILFFLTGQEPKDPDIYDRLIQLTTDRAHLNYSFVLILLQHGSRRTINQSIPLVRHILSKETDKYLLKEIIRAAGKMQIGKLTDDIAEFIFYDDPGLKSESVKALERIGTPKSLARLVQASKTEKCDSDILDAVQALSVKQKTKIPTPGPVKGKKDNLKKPPPPALDDLNSPDYQKRFDAFSALSLQDSTLICDLARQMSEYDRDLQINLLKLIKRTIPASSVNSLFDILTRKTTDTDIKFAAYSALESFPELKSVASVVKGLSEPSLHVRLAAIRVLDKNMSDFVFAEIRKQIESGTKKGEMLAQNILDARVKNIIEQMMISDTFSYMASNYLSRTAPIEALDTFIDILEARNLRSTARKYQDMREEKTLEPRKQFILISAYESVLSTYSKLVSTCGFSARTFLHPQDAFEAIASKKPDAVICDLFLNDMTGLDIAGEARQLYGKDQMPFIISTIQKGLDKALLEKEMMRAGVNGIFEFPPTASQIKSWIKQG